MDKRLIVSDYWMEEDKFIEDIVDRCWKFVELVVPIDKRESIVIECLPYIDFDRMIEKPWEGSDCYIEVHFTDFTWINGLGEERIQSVGMVVEDKGYHSHWINNEFVGKWEYEYHTGMLIQDDEEIYGLNPEQIKELFESTILDC